VTVAEKQIRAFVERIERLEEEIKDLQGDKSEMYQEAKANGYAVKVLKAVVAKRRKDPHEREEFDAVFSLYWEAMTRTDPTRAHARAA